MMASEKLVSINGDDQLLDEWPRTSSGDEWDGTGLLALLCNNQNPFGEALDVRSLMSEIEYCLGKSICDVPKVTYGANHFGFYLLLRDGGRVVARLSRGDMNKPGFDSTAMERQIRHDHFELDVYDVLYPLGGPFCGKPLYHRDPRKADGSLLTPNQGRRLFLFETRQGETFTYVHWRALEAKQQSSLLARSAEAAAQSWERIFGGDLSVPSIPVTPTREYCVALLTAKIEATLGPQSPIVIAAGKSCDPTASILEATRRSLLQLVPKILPNSTKRLCEPELYRLVLDHGDFGMHNMTISVDAGGQPHITSVYDWEGGSIVPAILSEPKMVTTVDLIIGDKGEPSISRWGDGDNAKKMAEYRKWTEEYYKALFTEVPEYRRIIKTGVDARRIWFALCNYRDKNIEEHFGELGAWAVQRMEESDMDGRTSWLRKVFCGWR